MRVKPEDRFICPLIFIEGPKAIGKSHVIRALNRALLKPRFNELEEPVINQVLHVQHPDPLLAGYDIIKRVSSGKLGTTVANYPSNILMSMAHATNRRDQNERHYFPFISKGQAEHDHNLGSTQQPNRMIISENGYLYDLVRFTDDRDLISRQVMKYNQQTLKPTLTFLLVAEPSVIIQRQNEQMTDGEENKIAAKKPLQEPYDHFTAARVQGAGLYLERYRLMVERHKGPGRLDLGGKVIEIKTDKLTNVQVANVIYKSIFQLIKGFI